MVALRAAGVVLSTSAWYALIVAVLGGRAALCSLALVLGCPGVLLWVLGERGLRAAARRMR